MGMLFTTEGTRRIVDTLNTAFGGVGVAKIRGYEATDQWLTKPNKDWRLARACYVYQIYPVSQDPNNLGALDPKHKKRWHYFLKNHLFVKFKVTHDQIRDAIKAGLTDMTISRFAFDHVEVDANANVGVVIFDAPIPGLTTKVRHVTLMTPAVPAAEGGSDFDPPQNGEGEPGQHPFPGA